MSGDRLPAWKAERVHWGHVQYRRRFRVTFPRYSRVDAVREAIAAALLPWEHVVTARTHRYWITTGSRRRRSNITPLSDGSRER